jgi:hypothetical protein
VPVTVLTRFFEHSATVRIVYVRSNAPHALPNDTLCINLDAIFSELNQCNSPVKYQALRWSFNRVLFVCLNAHLHSQLLRAHAQVAPCDICHVRFSSEAIALRSTSWSLLSATPDTEKRRLHRGTTSSQNDTGTPPPPAFPRPSGRACAPRRLHAQRHWMSRAAV